MECKARCRYGPENNQNHLDRARTGIDATIPYTYQIQNYAEQHKIMLSLKMNIDFCMNVYK